ncbi:MAG: phage baseplate assembly protein V [Desulfobacterales bacterium]
MSSIVTIPKLDIELDGMPIPAEEARTLAEVRVHQRLSLPSVCELTFHEPGGSLAGDAALLPGASLHIRVEGYPEPPLFDGEVTAVTYEYGPSRERLIRIRGYDFLHRLRKRQPVGAHVQLNLNELAQALVADLGVAVAAVDPGPLRQNIIQYNQSDLDLITQAAEQCGLYFTLRDGTLHLLTLEGIGNPVHLELGSSLLEVRIEVNTDSICRSVETTGWDPHRVEPVSGRADRARVSRRVAVRLAPDRVGGSEQRTIVDEALQDDRQADGIAQAELDRRVAREVILWGSAEGDPHLQPGTPVAVSGVAESVAGRYVLTAVDHIIDHTRGYVSEIDTTPPRPGTRSRTAASTLGVVSQIEDPDGRGRVRVVLPNFGGVETSWLPVVVPGAGPDKGLIALPDVDDQVLVLFLNEDPDQAIVLGGLYGADGPPDAGVEEGAVRRYTFTTPGAQRIQLDDGGRTVVIENSNGDFIRLAPEEVRLGDNQGSLIELTPGRCRIHAAADLEIGAPGKKVTISGQAIDFERA